ncbi:hypothetical protein CYMTET_39720 [Cymbomonas tetramitiformis]|uniref:MYND-type domain-containing protein n=1 Tax=Cymbomonas tetramitiformis TaxID=36881 RepID=A0AAE0C9K5_9CHLO|nr:hypothetical protein CYMTET_39720 [Cymbomonas tetramitiformis]
MEREKRELDEVGRTPAAVSTPVKIGWKQLIYETLECALRARPTTCAVGPDEDRIGVFAQRPIAEREEVMRHGWPEHTELCEGLVKVPLSALEKLSSDSPSILRNLERRFFRDAEYQVVPLDGGRKLTFQQFCNGSDQANIRCESVPTRDGVGEVQRYVSTRAIGEGEELLLEEGEVSCSKPGRHARVLEAAGVDAVLKWLPKAAGLQVRLAASTVHGVGIFACASFRRGCLIVVEPEYADIENPLLTHSICGRADGTIVNANRLKSMGHRDFAWLNFDKAVATEIRNRWAFDADMMRLPAFGLNRLTYMQYSNHWDEPNNTGGGRMLCTDQIEEGMELLESYESMPDYLSVQIRNRDAPWKICWNQYCSKISPFKCIACGVACYCTRFCQKRDWKRHKVDCVRKLEIVEQISSQEWKHPNFV